jgi:hypothetical protein
MSGSRVSLIASQVRGVDCAAAELPRNFPIEAPTLRAVGAIVFTPACLQEGRLLEGLDYLDAADCVVTHLRRVRLDGQRVRRIWGPQADEFTAERWDVALRMFAAGPAALALVAEPGWKGRGGSLAERLKELQGSPDPELLERHSLRARLGAHNKVNNLLHVPEGTEAMVRELAILLSPERLPALWRAAMEARPLADREHIARALAPSSAVGSVCTLHNAVRLRWRALVEAEELAGEAPVGVRESLRDSSQWLGRSSLAGAPLLAAWRRERPGDRFGILLSAWLGPDEALSRAMLSVDAVLYGEPISAPALEHDLAAAELDPDEWELVSLTTEIVAREA